MPTTKTAGRTLAAHLRANHHIGPRTRARRDGYDLKAEMLASIEYGVGADCMHEATAAQYRDAGGVVRSHRKHIEGYRVDGRVSYAIHCMTPWQFAGFLGEMLDAGVTNVGEGERFYSAMRQQVAA